MFEALMPLKVGKKKMFYEVHVLSLIEKELTIFSGMKIKYKNEK